MKKVLIIDQDQTLKKLFEIMLPRASFTLSTNSLDLMSNSGPFDLILIHTGVDHPEFKHFDLIVEEVVVLFPDTFLVALAWATPLCSMPINSKIFSPPFKIFQVISFVASALKIEDRFQDRHPGWS